MWSHVPKPPWNKTPEVLMKLQLSAIVKVPRAIGSLEKTRVLFKMVLIYLWPRFPTTIALLAVAQTRQPMPIRGLLERARTMAMDTHVRLIFLSRERSNRFLYILAPTTTQQQYGYYTPTYRPTAYVAQYRKTDGPDSTSSIIEQKKKLEEELQRKKREVEELNKRVEFHQKKSEETQKILTDTTMRLSVGGKPLHPIKAGFLSPESKYSEQSDDTFNSPSASQKLTFQNVEFLKENSDHVALLNNNNRVICKFPQNISTWQH